MLRASVGDSLMVGDSIFGNAGHADIIHEVKERNNDLKAKKEELKNSSFFLEASKN